MINLEMLNAIPPDCDYDEWVKVGMALKHEGADWTVWDDWSSRGRKYRNGECEKKWNSFRSNGVTGGTLFHIASRYGYEEKYESADYDIHNLLLDEIIVDPAFVSDEKIPPVPANYDPKAEMLEYFTELFNADDFVGYCISFYKDKDGNWRPSETNYRRTAGDIIEKLRTGTIKDALGTTKEAGAYIRFNPLDGKGENNSNVTRLKYCLIESDTDSIERQYSLFKAMNLPIKFLVYSGGQSLHAITHVDAETPQQYRQRVQELYSFCKKSGLTPDEQDKNESRFSRLPGVKRGTKWQYIVERNIGAQSYSEWLEWREEQADDLPPEDNFADVWDNMPDLKPELIEGVLRVGHKLLLSAPSKSGKSFLLMSLAIAIANGSEWLGMKCRKGRVCYVNCELDSASSFHRLKDIYEKLELDPENRKNIDVWNLRGRTVPMDKLSGALIHRFKDKGYAAVIIDPIYKVITGDENNATDMSKFCSYFDEVATAMGVSVIYCHHHSKGASGKYSNSADRSSGSGVFARDPDAILDMRRLSAEDAAKRYRQFHPGESEPTAWEISCTLREFAPAAPLRCWFDYPIHVPDAENFLASAKYQDSVDGGRGKGKNQKSREDWQEEARQMLMFYPAVTLEQLSIGEQNAKKQFDKNSEFEVATVDGVKVVHPRASEEIVFNGKTYKRKSSGAGVRWFPSSG